MKFLSFLFRRKKREGESAPDVSRNPSRSVNFSTAAEELPAAPSVAPPRTEVPASSFEPEPVSPKAAPEEAKDTLPFRRSGRIEWHREFFPMDVVGESSNQEALIAICGGFTRDGTDIEIGAQIELEPSNAFDPNAVVVKIQGLRVGYLRRDQAARVASQMREEGLSVATCTARIRGGWRKDQDYSGNYGVYLGIPDSGWIDFGIGTQRPTTNSTRKKVERPEAAESGPLKGHWIALMGAPRDGPVVQQLAAAGAKIMAGVGKSTTLLVVAEEKPFTPGAMRSANYRKAEELIAQGSELRIVSLSEARSMMDHREKEDR